MGIFVSDAGLQKYGPNDEIHSWYKLEQSRMGKAPPRPQVRQVAITICCCPYSMTPSVAA